MFCDSLLDAGPGRPSHHGLSTAIAFSLQAAGIAALLSTSLIYTGVLPPVHVAPPPFTVRMTDFSLTPLVNTAAPTPSNSSSTLSYGKAHDVRVIRASSGQGASSARDSGPLNDPAAPWGIEGPPVTDASTEITRLLEQKPVVPVPRPAEVTKRPDMSQIMESLLIHRVEPEYPPLATKIRTFGDVVLQAVISREGAVEDLRAISGHPLLVPAAMRAVREWRYRPCLLNGKPIEVEARIVIHFRLVE